MEEGGSDWLNSFFTFLYDLINPMESLEEEEDDEHSALGRAGDAQEEDDEDGDEVAVRKRSKDDSSQGQKIVIVGLHNQ